jgi:hypothetical protein
MKQKSKGSRIKQFCLAIGKHIKDNFISFVFSSLFGATVAVVVFLLTAPPKKPDEVRKALFATTLLEIAHQEKVSKKSLRLENALCFSVQTDIGLAETVVLFGSWGQPGNSYLPNHYVAVLDPAGEGLLDRLVGRQSFYELSSLTLIRQPTPDLLEVTNFEVLDVDNDGSKEIHLRLRATWADGISVTPLIYRRRSPRGWDLIVLPPIEETVQDIVAGKQPHPDIPPMMSPIVAFDGSINKSKTKQENKKIREDITHLFPPSVFQDDIPVTHDGRDFHLCFLRNGGDYVFRKHPVKNHFQIAVVGQLVDDRGVQADHHLVVMFLVLDGLQLKPDTLWNWGHAMFSLRPTKTSEISLDEIAIAGVRAHVAGNSFFGYTEFQRLEMGWDGQ